MSSQPLSPEEVQTFLEALDEAGEKLRELIDADDTGGSPAIQYFIEGSIFLEAGYLMVEQLGQGFPEVFRALHARYQPLFDQAEKGQIGWGEALSGLPEFLREYASDRVQQELFDAEGGEEA